jgi:uncharacterized protein YjiS (DUF1127 family)
VTSLALGGGLHYSGSPFAPRRDGAVTGAAYLLSTAIGKEIVMSSRQYRNLQAKPADVEALESLQHMTAWARQSVTSPEAAPMQTRFGEKTFAASVVDGLALGATAFHAGAWTEAFDELGEADSAREAQPRRPRFGARVLQAIGGAMARAWRYHRTRREAARAAAVLSQMDDRALQDIGINRADIGRAARYGRDWERWR